MAKGANDGQELESLEGDGTRPRSRHGNGPRHRARRRQLVGVEPGIGAEDRGGKPPGPARAGHHCQAVDASNRYAASQVGEQNKTQEVVKDAALGAVVGAAVGAAGGAVAGGGKGAGKGAAIGGIVGAGGGTLYGLNENKQHDEHYRAAYSSCMRSRGYTAG